MNFYTQALEGAQKELAEIEQSLAQLLPRRDALKVLIPQLEQVISAAPKPNEEHELDGEYLWQTIARIMKGVSSFTLSVATVEVEGSTGKTLGPFRAQKVRNSIIRHPEVFQRNMDGTYTVKESA